MDEHKEIIIIAVFQTLVIIVGWFATGVHLKFNGYPDLSAGFEITKHALWIRETGLVLILVPALWLVYSCIAEFSPRFAQAKAIYVTVGVCVTVFLTIALVWIATDVVHHPFTRLR